MYQIKNGINNLGWKFCQCIYLVIAYTVNLSFKHTNGFEFFIGIIVTTIIMNVVEFLILKIAYITTGEISNYFSCDSSERRIIHWIIRIGIISIVYLISLTPLCDIILTPIVRDCTQFVINCLNNFRTSISDSMVEVLLH